MSLKLQIVLCTVSITFLLSDVISIKTNVSVNQETTFGAFHSSNRTARPLSIDGNSIVNENT